MIIFIFRFWIGDTKPQAPSHVPVNSWMAETVQGDVEVATFCTCNRPLSHILTGSIPSDSASPLMGPSKPVPGFGLPGTGRDDPSRAARVARTGKGDQNSEAGPRLCNQMCNRRWP